MGLLVARALAAARPRPVAAQERAARQLALLDGPPRRDGREGGRLRRAASTPSVELTYIVANLSAGREELRGNRTESDVERFRTVTRIGYAIPILHPLIELDGDLYADGGFLWNVPFEYAEEWGADRHLHPLGGPSELPRADSLRFLPQVAQRMYDVFWRTFGNSSYLEKRLEDGQYHGINVTVIEPSPETGMFDPLGMLHAHPGKSKKLLWQGYRDTERALRGREPGERGG